MRFKSALVDGFRVYAVSGTNTVSFGIETTAAADKKGLLGFAVHRTDHTDKENFYMYGYKVFPSLIPEPTPETLVTTADHPIQSFVWDDFTAKPGHKYTYRFEPLKGKPKNIDRSAKPIKIDVQTEKQFDEKAEHDIFFNRGVASSQAYVRKFGNRRPDDPRLSDKKRAEAEEWLSRSVDEAIIGFIESAKKGDAIRGCFYEFHYLPVVEAFKAAIDRGVDVKLIIDAKVNASGDEKSFPREENLKTIKKAKIPMDLVIKRQANANNIQHNKFMVLLKGKPAKPTAVLTGSTNISRGGIFGQTNVAHIIRNKPLAESFLAYWNVLSKDPGGRTKDDAAKKKADNAAFKKSVEALQEMPAVWTDFPEGMTPVFSPRSGTAVLGMYAAMVDEAQKLGCITLAFGISKFFKDLLMDNPPTSHLVYLLLEKEDKPKKNSTTAFVALNSKQNVYKAWGSYLRTPFQQWARETSTIGLKLNKHVAYIHSKFLMVDPLSTSPVIVTGSANFSNASTSGNDENMIVIKGDQRVADIYFTEFNRLFFHYYFRSVVERTTARQEAGTAPGAGTGNATSPATDTLFLHEDSKVWLGKYTAKSFKSKRVAVFTSMKGFA